MNKARFSLFSLLGLLLAVTMPVTRAEDMDAVNLRPDIDVTVPRIQIRPPVSQPALKLYETLPARLYFNLSSEPSYRMETNPYQAPRNARQFIDTTQAFRIQNTATLGYALARKTRISAQYFHLTDEFDDFTRFKLDSTVQSVGVTLEQDLWQNRHWSVRSSLAARQLFAPNRQASGDIIPSLTAIRGIGNHGYGYANAALDINRGNFAIGNSVDRLIHMYTLGLGYQIPFDTARTWQKPLKGTSVSLSSTYSFTKAIHPARYTSDHYQNIIVTGEVARQVSRHMPVQLFIRAEPVFNFGQEIASIGISGFNFRLFGGLRASLNKAPVFTSDLTPPPQTGNSSSGGTP